MTGIKRGADTTQRNLRNAFTIGAGDQSLGIPTVHVTHDLGSKSDIACAQKGIGILPTTGEKYFKPLILIGVLFSRLSGRLSNSCSCDSFPGHYFVKDVKLGLQLAFMLG